MSILKLELKEEHVKLIKHLRWSLNSENQIVAIGNDGTENIPPFGENSIHEAIDLILNGVPEVFNPFNTEEIPVYSDEQKAEWDKLYLELPLALDIILYRGSFELGTYKTKWHSRNWRKTK